MTQFSMEIFMDERLRKNTKITAIVLIIIGVLGILLPQVLSITLSLLIALLLIMAGVVAGVVTRMTYQGERLAWLKPFLLISLGLLLLVYPAAGAAALGLLLIIYFLLDAFAGIMFALSLKPLPGWGWTMADGIFSLVLALIFIAGWPFSSTWLVGLLVGISLMLDGIALLMLVLSSEKIGFS
jgi:uncharacterized membrane protein HdeD (DUF308 family)